MGGNRRGRSGHRSCSLTAACPELCCDAFVPSVADVPDGSTQRFGRTGHPLVALTGGWSPPPAADRGHLAADASLRSFSPFSYFTSAINAVHLESFRACLVRSSALAAGEARLFQHVIGPVQGMHPCPRCGDQPLPAQFLEHAVHVHRRGVQSVAKRCLGDRNIGDVVLNTSELQELYGVSTASIRAFTLHSTLAQYSAQLLPEQIRELIKATGRDRGALVAASAHGRYRMEGRLPRTRSEVDHEDGGIRGMAQRAWKRSRVVHHSQRPR